ncbi:MAG TPA: ribonuclease P protein component [Candidatus Angelobacter sp.]|nr:ribonuclease P protein component [Candidatus Angelobacter sp.]
MKRILSLKKNSEFQVVFNEKQSVANRQFVVYKLNKDGQPFTRVGLSVSKKIGNAVTRNRIKRYIKNSLQQFGSRFKVGYDCVIIARKPTSDMSLEETRNSLNHVLKLAEILSKGERGKEQK